MKLTSAAPLLAALVWLTLSATTLPAQSNLPASQASVAQDPPAVKAEAADPGAPFSEALHALVPIVAIVMGCSIPIIIVAAVCYFNHRKTKMLHETVRAMVEKGVPIPPELFAKTAGWPNPNQPGGDPFQTVFRGPCPQRNDLRTGLLMTGLGFGLVVFVGNPGFIILFLGLAFLLVGFFERKKPGPEQTPKP